MAVTQEGFRWRNDNGSETTATWLAAQDTNATILVDATARLRLVLDTDADAAATAYTLYYKKTTDSTWLPMEVGAGGGDPVYIAASANITAGGQDTTAQLAAPVGKTTADFDTGRMWDDENGTDLVDITAPLTTPWINQAAFSYARNGTTTHVCTPASNTPIAGANFTPTAGRFLLLVLGCPPSANTPSGWTSQARSSYNANTYVFTRTAAGSDTITLVLDQSNVPAIVHLFEFPAGTTWVGRVTAQPVTQSAANGNLTGLTGTNTVMASKGVQRGTGSRTGTWDGANIEILDHDVIFSTTAGYWISIAYQANYSGSSYQPTCTVSAAADCETITWAVHPP